MAPAAEKETLKIKFTFIPKHCSSILDSSTQTLKAIYLFLYYTKSIQ
jgi:hypothetical protein